MGKASDKSKKDAKGDYVVEKIDDQKWNFKNAKAETMKLEINTDTDCIQSAPMKMFLKTMVFSGMNTEDFQVILQPLYAAYGTVFNELGNTKADALWAKVYKKAKFVK